MKWVNYILLIFVCTALSVKELNAQTMPAIESAVRLTAIPTLQNPQTPQLPYSGSTFVQIPYFNPTAHPYWEDGYIITNVKNRITLKILLENNLGVKDFSVQVPVEITYSDSDHLTHSISNKVFNVNYEVSPGNSFKQIDLLQFEGGHDMRVVIQTADIVFSPGLTAAEELTIKKAIELRSSITYDKIVDFDYEKILRPPNINITEHIQDQSIEICWDHIDGALEYDLEWVHTEGYEVSYATHFSFNENAARVTLKKNCYTMPIVYEEGYLSFRVRGKGINKSISDKLIDGEWSWSWPAGNIVPPNRKYESLIAILWATSYHITTAHENDDFNWQVVSSFAENGKRKDVVSYMDGTMRTRQTVTAVNSDKNALVAETKFDFQGRPALQTLPVPVWNDMRLKFRQSFNQNTSGMPYSKEVFDYDPSQCGVDNVPPLNSASGSAYYYSSSFYTDLTPEEKESHLATIPESYGYPFVQTEYTADNTGRISRQGGAGPHYQLGSKHETKYMYAVPFQEELNMLFGINVGIASHYKKNMVIDPNGQVSISYLDAKGNTIATSLAGEAPDALDTLESYGASRLNVDLLDKNLLNKNNNSIDASFVLAVPKKGDYIFHYGLTGEQFQDSCMAANVCYDCIYDLELLIVNSACGDTLFYIDSLIGNLIDPLVSSGSGSSSRQFQLGGPSVLGNGLSTCKQQAFIFDSDQLTLPKTFTLLNLEVGSYNVIKKLKVNEAATDAYVNHYINDTSNLCIKHLDDFLDEELAKVDTLDCMLDCGTIELEEGPYNPDDPITSEIDEFKEAVCDSLLDTPCKAAEKMMIADLSPGGQYALYDDNFSAFDYPLSILNPHNRLVGGPSNFWKPPHYTSITFANTDYVNINGISTDPATLSIKDYILYFNEGWVKKYFLDFHPERCYLDRCEDIEVSHKFDIEINEVDKYSEAYANGWFDINNNSVQIFNSDPYFNNVLQGTQISTFTKEISNFAGPNAASIHLWDFAVYTVLCDMKIYGGIPPVNPPPPSLPNCPIPPVISTENLDLLWQTYRAFYITAKSNAEYKIRTEYAIANGCYNECIGQEEFNPAINDFIDDSYNCPSNNGNFNNGVFGWGSNNPPWGAFACDRQPCNYRVYPYYQKKMKRFPSIYDAMRTMEVDFYNTPRADVFNNLLNGIVAEESIDCDTCLSEYEFQKVFEYLFENDYIPKSHPAFDYDHNELVASVPINIGNAKNVDLYYWNSNLFLGDEFKYRIIINESCIIDLSLPFSSSYNCTGSYVGNPNLQNGNPNGGDQDIDQATGWQRIWDNGIRPDFHSTNEVAMKFPNVAQPSNCLGFWLSQDDISDPVSPKQGVMNRLTQTIMPNTGLYKFKFDILDVNKLNLDAYPNNTQPSFDIIGVYNPNNSSGLNPQNNNTPSNIDLFGQSNSVYFGQFDMNSLHSPGNFKEFKFSFNSDLSDFPVNGITHIMLVASGGSDFDSTYILLDDFELCSMSKNVLYNSISSINWLVLDFQVESNIIKYTVDVVTDAGVIHSRGYANCKINCDPIPPDTSIACEPLPVARELRHLLHNISFNQDPNLTINARPISTGFVPRPMLGKTILSAIDTEDKTTDYFSFTKRDYKNGILLVLDSTECGIYLDYSNIQSPYTSDDIVLYTKLSPDYSQADMHGNTYAFDLEVMYADGTTGTISGESLACFPVGRCCVPIPTYSKSNEILVPKSKRNKKGKATKRNRIANTDIELVAQDKKKLKKDRFGQAQIPSSQGSDQGQYVFDPLCEDCPKFGFEGGIFDTIDIVTDCDAIFCADTLEIIEYGNINQDCIDFLYAVAEANAYIRHEQYIDSIAKDVRARYIKKCLKATEIYTGDFGYSQHHFTLYYYDQSNNLAQTVPPNGKRKLTSTDMTVVKQYQDDLRAHRLNSNISQPSIPTVNAIDSRWASEYDYNSLNQLTKQKIPDHGELKPTGFEKLPTEFYYDVLGRLVASQNPEQNTARKYSYSLYGPLGRILESGQMENQNGPPNQGPILTGTYKDGLIVGDVEQGWKTFMQGKKSQITTTTYDSPYYGTNPPLGSPQNIPGDNLRGRVAAAAYYENEIDLTNKKPDYVTHYSYDIHGNVKQLVQQPKDFRRKTIEYDYDLLSGNVNKVYYQRDEFDQFTHKYSYDADNRLTLVRTSRDGLIWQEDAKYIYYPHGPLARVELGQEEVQGLDYAYTLQGWIKGMNSASLSPQKDIGFDAIIGHKNQNFAHDEVGFILNYNKDDFASISGNIGAQSFESNFNAIDDRHGLFNGNIRSMTTAIQALMPNDIPAQYSYQYDQLNRIKAMYYHQDFDPTTYQWNSKTNPSTNPITNSPHTLSDISTNYRTSYTYDGNGNILTLERDGVDNNSIAKDMDRFAYNYITGTNRLTHVDDDQSLSSNYPNDIDDQSPNNYAYDRNGNMTSDITEGIQNIKWNLQGKVSNITKTNGKELTFKYDALGNRISKTYQDTTTYYIRDASGNAMAHYKKIVGSGMAGPETKSLRLESMPIYGSSRLGMYNSNLDLMPSAQSSSGGATNIPIKKSSLSKGQVQYELTNHLGNVLATVSDVKRLKQSVPSGQGRYFVDVGSASDYYPGGMFMPNRNTSINIQRYKHQGQESDDEISGTDNNYFYKYRMSDARLNRFWSVDPLFKIYPYNSKYAFSENRVMDALEVEGLESLPINKIDNVFVANIIQKPVFVVLTDVEINEFVNFLIELDDWLESKKGDGGSWPGGVNWTSKNGGSDPTRTISLNNVESRDIGELLDVLGVLNKSRVASKYKSQRANNKYKSKKENKWDAQQGAKDLKFNSKTIAGKAKKIIIESREVLKIREETIIQKSQVNIPVMLKGGDYNISISVVDNGLFWTSDGPVNIPQDISDVESFLLKELGVSSDAEINELSITPIE